MRVTSRRASCSRASRKRICCPTSVCVSSFGEVRFRGCGCGGGVDGGRWWACSRNGEVVDDVDVVAPPAGRVPPKPHEDVEAKDAPADRSHSEWRSAFSTQPAKLIPFAVSAALSSATLAFASDDATDGDVAEPDLAPPSSPTDCRFLPLPPSSSWPPPLREEAALPVLRSEGGGVGVVAVPCTRTCGGVRAGCGSSLAVASVAPPALDAERERERCWGREPRGECVASKDWPERNLKVHRRGERSGDVAMWFGSRRGLGGLQGAAPSGDSSSAASS
mmetsp:Transcript_21802/g.74964  ORF Transcript_21802/g.74964 Transcript_21802/m.74964 type:complete len:277 (-) Transcript_21802:1509-2339(-)